MWPAYWSTHTTAIPCWIFPWGSGVLGICQRVIFLLCHHFTNLKEICLVYRYQQMFFRLMVNKIQMWWQLMPHRLLLWFQIFLGMVPLVWFVWEGFAGNLLWIQAWMRLVLMLSLSILIDIISRNCKKRTVSKLKVTIFFGFSLQVISLDFAISYMKREFINWSF